MYFQVSQQVKKKGSRTTVIIIDLQAVKNTCNASVKSNGFHSVSCKLLMEFRKHLAIYSLGFLFFLSVGYVSSQTDDDEGLIEMLSDNIDYFKPKPVNIRKIDILLNQDLRKDTIYSA